jgi:AmmeMemoRadiSam system protein A
MTSEADRQLLLSVARRALTAYLTGAPPPEAESHDVLRRPAGVFVTLHHQGELRGCIGHVEASEPLGRVVARCAVAAGTSDVRFPAVTTAELMHIDIELSILGPLESISTLEHIEIGRHGLLVELGPRRGLLLPQVATEWQWDRETFVAQTCRKAGLRPDAWKTGAQIWRFDAEVFGEDTLRALSHRFPS